MSAGRGTNTKVFIQAHSGIRHLRHVFMHVGLQSHSRAGEWRSLALHARRKFVPISQKDEGQPCVLAFSASVKMFVLSMLTAVMVRELQTQGV